MLFFFYSFVCACVPILVGFLLLSPLLALVLFASCVYSSMRYCALWSIKRLFLSRLFMFFFPFNIFFFSFTFFFSFILCVGCCWIHLKEHKITCARLLLLLLLLLLFNRSFHRRITTISIKIILCVCVLALVHRIKTPFSFWVWHVALTHAVFFKPSLPRWCCAFRENDNLIIHSDACALRYIISLTVVSLVTYFFLP